MEKIFYTTIAILSPRGETLSTIGNCGRTPSEARRYTLEKIKRHPNPILKQKGMKYRVSTV